MAENEREENPYEIDRRIRAEQAEVKRKMQYDLQHQGISGFKAASRKDERLAREKMAAGFHKKEGSQ